MGRFDNTVKVLRIMFWYDTENKIFCAVSKDVPGLNVEAKTYPEMQEVVRDLVPDLLCDDEDVSRMLPPQIGFIDKETYSLPC